MVGLLAVVGYATVVPIDYRFGTSQIPVLGLYLTLSAALLCALYHHTERVCEIILVRGGRGCAGEHTQVFRTIKGWTLRGALCMLCLLVWCPHTCKGCLFWQHVAQVGASWLRQHGISVHEMDARLVMPGPLRYAAPCVLYRSVPARYLQRPLSSGPENPTPFCSLHAWCALQYSKDVCRYVCYHSLY